MGQTNPRSGGRTDRSEPKSLYKLETDDIVVEDIEPIRVPASLVFRHVTTSSTEDVPGSIEFPFYWSRLDNPELNGNPNALVFVTPVGVIEFGEETPTASMRQNEHPVGVVYRARFQRWYIYNLNLKPMALKATFNVVIERPHF